MKAYKLTIELNRELTSIPADNDDGRIDSPACRYLFKKKNGSEKVTLPIVEYIVFDLIEELHNLKYMYIVDLKVEEVEIMARMPLNKLYK